MFKYLIGAFLGVICSLSADTLRISSHPFLTGDTLRNACDMVYDDNTRKINPNAVVEGSTVFVQTVFLEEFFRDYHHKIRFPYVLITHNSDESIPGKFARYLDDPLILAWYGMNVEGEPHPKLHPIPIGLPNRILPYGNVEVYLQMMELVDQFDKEYLLYLNFTISTNIAERGYVYKKFKDRPYSYAAPMKDQRGYLRDLVRSYFVLSPRGFGLDCHRTWESILMGAIPILKSSSLDDLLKDLPALIIEDWDCIDENFLQTELKRIQSRHYSLDSLFIDYWLEEINQFKY